MSDPWFKFFPSDWRQDPMLRMCSLGARGLWIEMIALMHQANPYGHLLVSGLSPTDTQLAALVGCPPDQITHLVGELETAGVFSRTRSGVIYSRKMTRMQKKAATARNNGRKGGNPTLGKQTDIPPLDNQEDKPEDKPQKLEPELELSIEIGKPISCSFDDFWAVWPNKTAKQKAQAAWRRLSPAQRDAAKKAVDGGWFQSWQDRMPNASPILPATFLNGRRWDDQPAPPRQPTSLGFPEIERIRIKPQLPKEFTDDRPN